VTRHRCRTDTRRSIFSIPRSRASSPMQDTGLPGDSRNSRAPGFDGQEANPLGLTSYQRHPSGGVVFRSRRWTRTASEFAVVVWQGPGPGPLNGVTSARRPQYMFPPRPSDLLLASEVAQPWLRAVDRVRARRSRPTFFSVPGPGANVLNQKLFALLYVYKLQLRLRPSQASALVLATTR